MTLSWPSIPDLKLTSLTLSWPSLTWSWHSVILSWPSLTFSWSLVDLETHYDLKLTPRLCVGKAIALLVELASLQTSFVTLDEVIKVTNRYTPSINQPINQSTNQPINQSFNQPINQSTNQSINQLRKQKQNKNRFLSAWICYFFTN